ARTGRADPAAGEPALAVVLASIESREPDRLDVARAAQADVQPVPASRQHASPIGWIGSLGLHLLPLLVLLDWSVAPAEIAQPIPVQLVIEAPPPAPAPPPQEAKRPAPDRLASREMGETSTQPDRSATAARDADRPDETQMAA